MNTFHAIITWLGVVGSGEEGSPLSANSSLSEVLRLVQIAMAAGVIYLIKLLKTAPGVSPQLTGEVKAAKELAETNFKSNRELIELIKTELKDELAQINVKLNGIGTK